MRITAEAKTGIRGDELVMGLDLVNLRTTKSEGQRDVWKVAVRPIEWKKNPSPKLGALLDSQYSLLANHIHAQGVSLHQTVKIFKGIALIKIQAGNKEWLLYCGMIHFRKIPASQTL